MGLFHPVIPIILTVLFLGYLLYLAFIRRNIRAKLQTVVLPGMFFISIWAAIYLIVL